jgi:hypothetical protein
MKHYVMINVLSDTPRHALEDFCQALHQLQDALPFMSHLETGIDELRESRSWHLALSMVFPDTAHLAQYQQHPDHVRALAKLKPYIESVAVVDFDKEWLPS